MSLARGILTTLLLSVACSGSDAKSTKSANVVDEPWSRAHYNAPDGWYKKWRASPDSTPPYGPGTRFETETIGLDGSYSTETIEVVSIEPRPSGRFQMVLRSSRGQSYRDAIPPDFLYTRGNPGYLATRNTKLLPVTVPAGSFSAGRMYDSEQYSGLVYVRDVWVVPDIPIPVQSWSRPVTATELYNPPADGTVPHGTILTRLVRVEKQ